MELIGSRVCMKKDVGVHSNMFGGYMLAIIDEAAAAYACMYANTKRMVTLKISELLFKKPVREGQIIKIYGDVIKVGKTSLTLRIVVKNHEPSNAEETITTETEMVFVRINDLGEKTAISDSIREKFNKSYEQINS
jgi:acyl-CoA thioesterase YciA